MRGEDMKKSFKTITLAVAALLVGGLCWFGVNIRRSDHIMGATSELYCLLTPYLADHGGDLPNSWAELEAYHGEPMRFPYAEWLDVAWGTKADEINAEGVVVTRDRLVVRASDEAPDWFRGIGVRLSRWIAESIVRIRPETVSTAPATQVYDHRAPMP
jgi:hypothetical protein